MRNFNTDWKKTYWPDPIGKVRWTRTDVIRSLRGAPPKRKKSAMSLSDAMSALAALTLGKK